jgi:hypothetical protein
LTLNEAKELYFDGILTARELVEEMDLRSGLKTHKTESQVWDVIHIAQSRWDGEMPTFFLAHLLYSDQRVALRQLIEREELIATEPNHYYRQVAEVCWNTEQKFLRRKANQLFTEISDLSDLMQSAKEGLVIYLVNGEKVRLQTVAWYQDEILTKAKLLDIIDTFIL